MGLGFTITISGKVQGVGFRPYVKNLAVKQGLVGRVFNTNGKVAVELAKCSEKDIDRFIELLNFGISSPAFISNITVDSENALSSYTSFEISHSDNSGDITHIPVDIAICEACRAELTQKGGPYFCYSFNACALCGPRYSVIKALPYDRENTSMHPFELCEHCTDAYQTDTNRRFWGQSISCNDCGPRLQLYDFKTALSNMHQVDIIKQVSARLLKGEIVAVKNTGGYQLLVDATNAKAVARLRNKKHRATKPFAVLMRDLAQANSYVTVSEGAREKLSSHCAPIVILPKKNAATKSSECIAEVAPGRSEWGVMLAHSALQLLICDFVNRPLICSSANLSGELMIIDDDLAKRKLGELADCVVYHDRQIVHRVDDSVYRVTHSNELLPIRHGRGVSPQVFEHSVPVGKCILCLGADMKASFSLVHNGCVIVSQYLGDLYHVDAYDSFIAEIEQWLVLYEVQPELIVCDLHPDYYSTQIALHLAHKFAIPCHQLQHHLAHLGALYLEHQLSATHQCIGMVMDGLGFGEQDNDELTHLWGCEIFTGQLANWQRQASLKPIPLVGGEKAIEQPWRLLVAFLEQADIEQGEIYSLLNSLYDEPSLTRKRCDWMIQNCSRTRVVSHALGRLLDAVAVLLGCVPLTIEYDGQAPQMLEALAMQSDGKNLSALPYEIERDGNIELINLAQGWQKTLSLLKLRKVPRCDLAWMWHRTIANIMVALATINTAHMPERERTDVLLSGGCMQNVLLHEMLCGDLEKSGFKVWTHQNLPANDGAISAGQAIWAAHVLT